MDEQYRLVTVTAQVERTFKAKGNEEQARKRVRNFLNDPDAMGEGVVVEQTDPEQPFRNSTPWKINKVEELPGVVGEPA